MYEATIELENGFMSKGRKKTKTIVNPEPEVRERGRPPRGYPIHAFQLRIPDELHHALLAALSKTRRAKNTEITMAIEAWLTDLGTWPPNKAAD